MAKTPTPSVPAQPEPQPEPQTQPQSQSRPAPEPSGPEQPEDRPQTKTLVNPLDHIAVSNNLVKLHYGPIHADTEQVEKMARLASLTEALAQSFVNLAPNCAARAQALHRLSECRWWCEQAILTKGR